jgi:trimeric autotransporter adhesin
MAKPVSIPNSFATSTAAIPLSYLDQNFNALANSTNDLVNGLRVGKGANAVATNTALGVSALNSGSLSGTQNTGIGWGSLFSNTTGSPNTAVGYGSLFLNTTGNANTAIGMEALRNNTTVSGNTAVGYRIS